MFVKDVMVQNQVGLHARPATFFIQKANEFKSSIWIEKEERRVNAKSLLGILSLGIVGGTQIRIIADGADEQEAVTALTELRNPDNRSFCNFRSVFAEHTPFVFLPVLFFCAIFYSEYDKLHSFCDFYQSS